MSFQGRQYELSVNFLILRSEPKPVDYVQHKPGQKVKAVLRRGHCGGGDDEGGFGREGGRRAELFGLGSRGRVGFPRADAADIFARDDDRHDDFISRVHRPDLLEDARGCLAVIVQSVAVETCEHGAVGVIVQDRGVGEGQGAGFNLRPAGLFFPCEAGFFGGAALHSTAQGKDGALIVAGTVVDDADLPVGVGVVGVYLQGAIGIARGCHRFTAADVSVGDSHVGDGVFDAELLIEADGFGKQLKGFIEIAPMPVEDAGADIEEGQVWGDRGGFFVPLNGEVVFAENFIDIGLHTAHIHELFAVLARLGNVILRLGEFVLVDEDFSVVGFGEGVVRVELDGSEGFSFRLVAEVFGEFAGEGWVGEPTEHERAHREDVGVVWFVLFGNVDDSKGFVETVASFLVGCEAGRGVGENAGEFDAHRGVFGFEDKGFIERFDRLLEVACLKVGFAFGNEGVDAASGRGGGDEGRPDFTADVFTQKSQQNDDNQQDKHDAVGIGVLARMTEEVFAFVDVHAGAPSGSGLGRGGWTGDDGRGRFRGGSGRGEQVLFADFDDLAGIVDAVGVIGNVLEKGVRHINRIGAAVNARQSQPIAAVKLDDANGVGERNALNDLPVFGSAAADGNLKESERLVVLPLAVVECSQVGIEIRVLGVIAQGKAAVLDALIPLAQHAVDPRDEEVRGRIGGIEGIGFGKFEYRAVELTGVDEVAPQRHVEPGNVGVDGDSLVKLRDGFFVVAGNFEDISARPMPFKQVGLKRQGGAGFFDGKVEGVEFLQAGFDAKREDVGEDGMPKTAVLVKFDGTPGVGFAIEIFLLEAFRPTGEGKSLRGIVIEQNGVLGVDLRLDQLVGKNLQTRDFEVVADVLRVGVDRALVSLNCLEVFPFGGKSIGFVDERLRVARGGGGRDEGRVNHRHDDDVKVDQHAD